MRNRAYNYTFTILTVYNFKALIALIIVLGLILAWLIGTEPFEECQVRRQSSDRNCPVLRFGWES